MNFKDNQTKIYEAETIGSIMSTDIPSCLPTDSLATLIKNITSASWSSVNFVFITNEQGILEGLVDLRKLSHTDTSAKVEIFKEPIKFYLHPEDDQEKAVYLAVKDDLAIIPVVNDKHAFLGAVTSKTIINIMHQEHIEDALLASGIRHKGSNILKLATQRTSLIIGARAPWLIGGLVVGLGLGLISSWFEASLKETIALAYFIPVVAYVADSVGTQSEAIAIRALATINISYGRYILKELQSGLILGLMLGILGGFGAQLISHSTKIAEVVGLSLFTASVLASVLAVAVPIGFKKLNKDPALGSGPVATALQDTLSVIIYFGFAALIL